MAKSEGMSKRGTLTQLCDERIPKIPSLPLFGRTRVSVTAHIAGLPLLWNGSRRESDLLLFKFLLFDLLAE